MVVKEVIVENIQPYTTFTIAVNIPPLSDGTYSQRFDQPTILPATDYNFISGVSIRIDTSGIWNIPVTEVFKLGGVPTTILAGCYDLPELRTLCNITVPETGANAFLTQTNQTLQFAPNSALIYVLGLQDYGTNLIPTNIFSADTVNITGDLDTLYVSNNLISQSTSFGGNFIAVFPLSINKPGTVVTFSSSENIPIINPHIQEIVWSLYGANKRHYNIKTNIIITMKISSQKK
jgi:hypothetical protein